MMHVQQDHDSAHDVFQTQNIGIKDISAKGNVDITLQNLAAGMTNWYFIKDGNCGDTSLPTSLTYEI